MQPDVHGELLCKYSSLLTFPLSNPFFTASIQRTILKINKYLSLPHGISD
jgi:hypothetical protein